MHSHHQPVTSSGYVTTSKVVVAGLGALQNKSGNPGGYLHGVILFPDGTHASSVTVYNSDTSTSGNEVSVVSIPASTTQSQAVIFTNPVSCPNGIYAAIAGTGGSAILLYSVGI